MKAAKAAAVRHRSNCTTRWHQNCWGCACGMPVVPLKRRIRRIIVNTAIETYRRNRRSGQPEELDEVYDDAQQTFAMDNLECEDILRLIQSLPDGYRMVFNMYAIEGFSHREIAESLQI